MSRPVSIVVAVLAGILFSTATFAEVAATVTHLSGTVSALKANGSTLILSQKSTVEAGDVLTTEKESYAMLRFTDGGEVTMRPLSRLKMETYDFKEDQPEKDSFVFSLLKGGLRTVTGLVGHRGNRDAYQLKTATATIGIRGTNYEAHMCQGDCGGSLQDGLYLQVHDGAINAANDGGTLDYTAGQFGFVQNARMPPIILPQNPGLPTFTATTGASQSEDGGGSNATRNTDCLISQ